MTTHKDYLIYQDPKEPDFDYLDDDIRPPSSKTAQIALTPAASEPTAGTSAVAEPPGKRPRVEEPEEPQVIDLAGLMENLTAAIAAIHLPAAPAPPPDTSRMEELLLDVRWVTTREHQGDKVILVPAMSSRKAGVQARMNE